MTKADRTAHQAGLDAGRTWAEELATFDDLDRLQAELDQLPTLPPYLRGLVEGALSAGAELDGDTFRSRAG